MGQKSLGPVFSQLANINSCSYMAECLIIGGGVIGLSLAYELSSRGASVHLLERGQPGQEASWAGAGLLPPANENTATHPHDQLAGLSHQLHPRWALALREETGIDTGYHRTGSIHIARDADQVELLHAAYVRWRKQGIRVEEIATGDIAAFEPRLSRDHVKLAVSLPDEAQLRNPRHLKALAIACQRKGVTLETGAAVEGFERHQGKVTAVLTALGRRTARTYCLCGGAWSSEAARQLGIVLPMVPIRGQMVLLNHRASLLRIINEGRRYIVPRADGRLLVGSTEEQAGFDKRTTAEGVAGLIRFALELVPELAAATFERSWAGLRPGTPDGMPYLGRMSDLENVFVATGHYRGGIHLSPGTAQVLARLILGENPGIDLSAFRVDRFASVSAASPFTV